MTDGLSNAEEKSLSVLNGVFEDDNIPIVGASSADDLSFKETFASYNGKIYSNATIVTLIHNNNGKINIYKENIYELDGKPIIQTYANILNVPESNISKCFMSNPIARIIGDESFISSFKKVENDNSISLYARIYKNSYVTILKPKDPIKVLDETINKVKNEMPNISGSIVINCIFRTLLFKEKNITSEFTSRLQKLGPFAGITSYGEQLNNKHLNQTMLLICFE